MMDNILYQDTGCYYYPKCLECPAPCCVYDDIERFHSWRKEERMKKKLIEKQEKAQLQVEEQKLRRKREEEYAAAHGITIRTAQNHLRRTR